MKWIILCLVMMESVLLAGISNPGGSGLSAEQARKLDTISEVITTTVDSNRYVVTNGGGLLPTNLVGVYTQKDAELWTNGTYFIQDLQAPGSNNYTLTDESLNGNFYNAAITGRWTAAYGQYHGTAVVSRVVTYSTNYSTSLASTTVGDGITFDINGGVGSVAKWIPENLIANSVNDLVRWGGVSRGLLDGPGYLFNDQNGLLVDQSTNYTWANVGYANSVTVSNSGVVYGAIVCPTDTDYGSAPFNNLWTSSSGFTLSFWFKSSNFSEFIKDYFGNLLGSESLHVAYFPSAGGFYFGFQPNGVGNYVKVILASNFTENVWYHLILVYDVTAGSTMWLDGTERSQAYQGTNPAGCPTNFADLYFGGIGNYFRGSDKGVSDFRIWNRPLDTNEIATTFLNTIVTNGLTAWWRFGEGSGTTFADSIGSATGTLTGSVVWTNSPVIDEGVAIRATNSMSLVCTNKVMDFLPTATWMSVLASGLGLTANDLQGYVSPDYGTNWYQASLIPSDSIDLSNTLFQGTAYYTNNVSDSNLCLKVVTSSNKVVKVLGMWGPSN
jgi:hypothetical protein